MSSNLNLRPAASPWAAHISERPQTLRFNDRLPQPGSADVSTQRLGFPACQIFLHPSYDPCVLPYTLRSFLMDFLKWASSDPSPSPLRPLPTARSSCPEQNLPGLRVLPASSQLLFLLCCPPPHSYVREDPAPQDMHEIRPGSGPCFMQERQSAGPLPDSKRRYRPTEDACDRKIPRSLHKEWRPSPALPLEAYGLSFLSCRDVRERHASYPNLWAKEARTEFMLLGHGEKLPKCD